ncbi:hypothetical protein WDU94_010205 [Cyamophila willieti]
MASPSIVRLGCFAVLLCALQVSAFWENNPKVQWVPYDPNQQQRKFKTPLAQWDGADLCKGNSENGGPVENLCLTSVRNTFLSQNGFENEDFHAECATSGDLPPGVSNVCWLREQRRSKRTGGFQHKTVLEIQVYQDAGDKKCHARFSEPYEH